MGLTNVIQMCYNLIDERAIHCKWCFAPTKRGEEMDKKLVITAKKYRGESTVVSMRIPAELLQKLDSVVEKTGRTRNDLVQTCLEFALDNMEIEEQ